jgi:Fibronectin type III domain
MSDLLAGTVYTFRVCGVSRLGRGEWSQESVLVCTDTDVPPQCTRPLVESVHATAITLSFLAPEPTLPQMQTHYFDVHIAGGALTSNSTNSSVSSSGSSSEAMPKLSVTWEEAKLAGQEFLNSLNTTKRGSKSLPHKSNVSKLKHKGERATDGATATATAATDTAATSESTATVLRSNSADAVQLQQQLQTTTEHAVHSKHHETNNNNSSSNSNSSSSTQRVHDLRHKPFHVLLCATVQHLQPGTYYRFAVSGVNAQGSGAASLYSHSCRTPAVVPGPCPVPAVTAVNGNVEAVEVHWQAGDDGGSAVTSFALSLCRVDAVTGAAVHDDAVRQQQIKCKRIEVARVIEGLTAGAWYSCRVRALNAEGQGAWSELSQPCRYRAITTELMFHHRELSIYFI